VIAPGATREASFTATAPGTYYYAGQTVPGPLQARIEEDSQLNGAIVVVPRARSRRLSACFLISGGSLSTRRAAAVWVGHDGD
jgi:hypothetical protein